VDLESITSIITLLANGGPTAIIAVLVLIIVGLCIDRRRLLAEITRKDDKIDKIVDDYYKGNLTLSEALNSLKNVLYDLKGKL